jgi:hypothetical protein
MDTPTAFWDEVIGVTGTSQCNELMRCNCLGTDGAMSGPNPTLAAPFQQIWSTTFDISNKNTYSQVQGTSLSTAITSGVTALVLSANPLLTSSQVKDILETSVDKVGGYTYYSNPSRTNGDWSDQLGYGKINARKAVDNAIKSSGIDLNYSGTVSFSSLPISLEVTSGFGNYTIAKWTWYRNGEEIMHGTGSTITPFPVSEHGNFWLGVKLVGFDYEILSNDIFIGNSCADITENLPVTSVPNDIIENKFETNSTKFEESFSRSEYSHGRVDCEMTPHSDFASFLPYRTIYNPYLDWYNLEGKVNETLILLPGTKLTIENSSVYFAECAGIVVLAGAELVIINSILTSCDNETWRGIIVDGDGSNTYSNQGKIVMSNGLIENAAIGVSIGRHGISSTNWDISKAGGLFDILGTVFNNNYLHIAVGPNASTQDYNDSRINGIFQTLKEIENTEACYMSGNCFDLSFLADERACIYSFENSKFKIDGSTFYSKNTYAQNLKQLWIDGANNLKLLNNSLQNNSKYGMYVKNVINSEINNNYFMNGYGTTGFFDNVEDVDFMQNHVGDIFNGSKIRHGIVFKDYTRLVFSNNEFENCVNAVEFYRPLETMPINPTNPVSLVSANSFSNNENALIFASHEYPISFFSNDNVVSSTYQNHLNLFCNDFSSNQNDVIGSGLCTTWENPLNVGASNTFSNTSSTNWNVLLDPKVSPYIGQVTMKTDMYNTSNINSLVQKNPIRINGINLSTSSVIVQNLDPTMQEFDDCSTPSPVLSLIEEVSSSVNIFPNPTNGLLTLENLNVGKNNMKIYDNSGKILYENDFLSETVNVDISTLPKGIYILKISQPHGESLFRKIVKF